MKSSGRAEAVLGAPVCRTGRRNLFRSCCGRTEVRAPIGLRYCRSERSAPMDEFKANRFNLTRVFCGTYHEVPGSFNITGNTLAPAKSRYICPWARSETPTDGRNQPRGCRRQTTRLRPSRRHDHSGRAYPTQTTNEQVCRFFEWWLKDRE